MIHHDARQYDIAVKEATEHFQQTIDKKVGSAARIMQNVLGSQPHDRIVGTQDLRFAYTVEPGKDTAPDTTTIVMTTKRGIKGAFEEPMHKHALNQAAERAGIPETFVNRMLNRPYGGELIVENLNTIFGKEEPARFLVRSVDTQVRGVLSDSYKRLDSRRT